MISRTNMMYFDNDTLMNTPLDDAALKQIISLSEENISDKS